MSFQIESRPLGPTRCEIVLRGRLHADGADELRRVVDEALGGAHTLVFDARALQSIDAVALAVVVDAVKRTRPRGGEVAFFGLPPVVRRLFDLVGLTSVVTLNEAREDVMRGTS